MLDILFTFNIALSMIVLLAGVYAARPLDFAAFPSVLLVATLFRLALNIASTRVVLLDGANGTGSAGRVIEAFGEVVIGGNYAVGFIVFLILVIINFVVVTKGAGRISEVTARFTLDAMPGKQMSIDADLNAGIVNVDEAKVRRAEISQEADFYGSMDGASKFVRGDAIAGILILLINLVGGIIIGMLQHSLNFADAMHVYGILTIGDGLVAQIPSLFLSTAAAIMVTRVSKEGDMGKQISQQLFENPKSLLITGAVVGILGLIPGMPHMAFLGLGIIAAASAYGLYRVKFAKTQENTQQAKTLEQADHKAHELDWDDVESVEPISIQVGFRLIPLVDKAKNSPLMGRLKGIRRQCSKKFGFLFPAIHVKDNLDLDPNQYSIALNGVNFAKGMLIPDKLLAINPANTELNLKGTAVKDPTFGLDALWIDKNDEDDAKAQGVTVVDAATVLATHLNELLKNNAYMLLGYAEIEQLLNRLGLKAPKLIEDIKNIPNTVLLNVLQSLLKEAVPINDLQTIAGALAHVGSQSQDPDVLLTATRVALKGIIVQSLLPDVQDIECAILDPNLEQILLQTLQTQGKDAFVMEPVLADAIRRDVTTFTAERAQLNKKAIVMVCAPLRLLMARFFGQPSQSVHFLSFAEVPDNKNVKVIKSIGHKE